MEKNKLCKEEPNILARIDEFRHTLYGNRGLTLHIDMPPEDEYKDEYEDRLESGLTPASRKRR